jgi:protocatechuate 3,4-dioxygenase alpha subunit
MGEPARIPSPYCTTGPFFPYGFADEASDLTVFEGRQAKGQRIVLAGRVLENGGKPTRNTIVEIWQPDANGIFRHPLDPRSADVDPGFFGWGRARTNAEGRYRFQTMLPGAFPAGDGRLRLPHVNLMVLAIGLTRRLVTTAFFAEAIEAASDPVLDCVTDAAARRRLFAIRDASLDSSGSLGYRFDLILRGDNETPFFLD